jgi:hypothetical protein
VARPAWPDGPWRPQDLDGLAYFSPGNVQGKSFFNLDLRSTASVARPAWPTGPWRLQDLDGHGNVYLTGRGGSWPHLNVVLHLRSRASVARSAWPTSSAAAGPCWSRNCLSHRSGRLLATPTRSSSLRWRSTASVARPAWPTGPRRPQGTQIVQESGVAAH